MKSCAGWWILGTLFLSPLSSSAATVKGYVRDWNGTPIAEVRVRWSSTAEGSLTEPDGSYVIDAPEGPVRFEYSKDGFLGNPQEEDQVVRSNQPLRTVRLFKRPQHDDFSYFAAVSANVLQRVKSGEKLETVWAEFEHSGAPPAARVLTAQLALFAFGKNNVPKSIVTFLEKDHDRGGLDYVELPRQRGFKIKGFEALSETEIERIEANLKHVGVRVELESRY